MSSKKTFKFDKLIRDNFYQKILKDNNVSFKLKNLSNNEELLDYFKLKITEEANEVAGADSKEHLIEELADCLEVIHGFAKILGLNFDDIETARQHKLIKRGGFSGGIVVDTISLTENHELAQYCLKYSDKYPEIEVDIEC